MKLWRLRYHDENAEPAGIVSLWFTAERAARRRLAELHRDPPPGFQLYRCERVEVPTTRAALAQFLTSYEP